MQTRHWQDWVTGAVGLWLIACPFILDVQITEGSRATLLAGNFLLCGGFVVVLAASALATFRPWEEWLTACLGLWLIASPWLLGFAQSRPETGNAVGAGIILVSLAAWALFDDREAGAA